MSFEFELLDKLFLKSPLFKYLLLLLFSLFSENFVLLILISFELEFCEVVNPSTCFLRSLINLFKFSLIPSGLSFSLLSLNSYFLLILLLFSHSRKYLLLLYSSFNILISFCNSEIIFSAF